MRSIPVAPAPPAKGKSGEEKAHGARVDRQEKEAGQHDRQQKTSDRLQNSATRRSPGIASLEQNGPPSLVSSSSVEEGDVYADEDDQSTDDPYTYSDDSLSLNDAYFLPQQDSGLFGMPSDNENERDDLASPMPSTSKSGDGAPRKKRRNPSSNSRNMKSKSNQQQKYTLSSSINEDEAVTESTALLHGTPSSSPHLSSLSNMSEKGTPTTTSPSTYAHRQHRKRQLLKKQKRNLRLKQQEKQQRYQQEKQVQRERAVTEVRGQPQPPKHSDRFWSILFFVQFLFVIGLAVKYGLSLTRPSLTVPVANLPSSITSLTIEQSSTNHYVMAAFSSPSSKSPSSSKSNSSLPIDSSKGSTTTLKQNNLEHLEDDDNIHPIMPKSTAENLRSKSTVSTTTTTTTNADGDSVVVIENAHFTIDYKNVLSLLLISGLYTCVTSYLSFSFMLIVARSLIPIMLVFTILLLLCWGIFGMTVVSYGGSIIPILGFAFFGLSLAYAMANWTRIPFCSTNLYTALCAIRSSVGILLVGVGSLFVALLWMTIWAVALMGILNMNNSTDCAISDECETHVVVIPNGRAIELVVLLISLYWTTMVIKNIVRVTVASAIGSWWLSQNDNAVSDPLLRACSSSFGTICFGSLVSFPAQALSVIGNCLCFASGWPDCNSSHWAATPTKRMSSSVEQDDEETNNDATDEQEKFLDAVAKKISAAASGGSCIRRIGRKLQACNRWSYTYIGMYNYSFIEGGEKAIQLFETREWMDIVRDNLIQNILLMASIVIGGLSGLVAVVVEEVDGYTFTSLHKPIITAFWIGFILGFILSNVLMLGLVGSAVNTVLVCFAAEPFEFDRNHPRLSREMREVWSQQVWEPDPESRV